MHRQSDEVISIQINPSECKMVIIVKRYFNLYLDLALQMLDIQLTHVTSSSED